MVCFHYFWLRSAQRHYGHELAVCTISRNHNYRAFLDNLRLYKAREITHQNTPDLGLKRQCHMNLIGLNEATILPKGTPSYPQGE